MYSAEISRANPTCFVFLLDQSRSMEDRIGGDGGDQIVATGALEHEIRRAQGHGSRHIGRIVVGRQHHHFAAGQVLGLC